MAKPESRCLGDMVLGTLKPRPVFVNQTAASLREPLKPKDVCKRPSAQYLKEGCAENVRKNHLGPVGGSVSKDDFILMDGTDISKKHAKFMEGPGFVKNGGTGEIGLGHNVLNINAINAHKEITPLYSKAYSYQMGALSSNNEMKNAVRDVKGHISDKGCRVFDRGADNGIPKGFFIGECPKTIIRSQKNTRLFYKQEECQVSKSAGEIEFSVTREVVKTKKNKPVARHYDIGAVQINYTIKGVPYPLWPVVSRNKKHGGSCCLLVESGLKTAIEVGKWAFNAYGMRWEIEEYHRHIKQEHRLEDIQLKTFGGLQSMLAVLTVAMYMIYKKTQSIHIGLLLDVGYNFLNEHRVSELVNFIYCKISKVVSILPMPARSRTKISKIPPLDDSGQLNLLFS